MHQSCVRTDLSTVRHVGLGPVGLATLMLARSMGANKLIGVDAPFPHHIPQLGFESPLRYYVIRPGFNYVIRQPKLLCDF